MYLTTSEGEFELKKRHQFSIPLDSVRRQARWLELTDPFAVYTCGDTREQIKSFLDGDGEPSEAMLKAIHLEKWNGGYRIPIADYEGCTELLKRVRRPKSSSTADSTKPI